jgi:hypothetical protein
MHEQGSELEIGPVLHPPPPPHEDPRKGHTMTPEEQAAIEYDRAGFDQSSADRDWMIALRAKQIAKDQQWHAAGAEAGRAVAAQRRVIQVDVKADTTVFKAPE